MASLVWDQALDLPIEQPTSISTPELTKLVEAMTMLTICSQNLVRKNPWPNEDAHSGVLLKHFGLKEQY